MRSRRTEPSIDAGSDPAQELTPPVDDADYCCSGEGSAMSAVNHQFRLAVRLAETFASASRTLSGWVRVSSRSPTPNRSRERGRSPGKPPLSDDDQWPLCAKSGHSTTTANRRSRKSSAVFCNSVTASLTRRPQYACPACEDVVLDHVRTAPSLALDTRTAYSARTPSL
jgi:hypothetical protein